MRLTKTYQAFDEYRNIYYELRKVCVIFISLKSKLNQNILREDEKKKIETFIIKRPVRQMSENEKKTIATNERY